jgi:hypothetical protein
MKETDKQIEDKKNSPFGTNQKLDQAKANVGNSSAGQKETLMKKETPPISGIDC